MARACKRSDGVEVKSMRQWFCHNCKRHFSSQSSWFNHTITIFRPRTKSWF